MPSHYWYSVIFFFFFVHSMQCISPRMWKSSYSPAAVCIRIIHSLTEELKNQLDATCYFIVLLIGSTCFGHYYAHHQELATIMLITTLVVSFLVCCMLEAKARLLFSLQPGHYSSLTAPNLQLKANQERNGQCGNQHYSRELLMMGIVMPETCWAYEKYNKIISDI